MKEIFKYWKSMPWACCLPSFAQNGFGKKGRWHTMKYPTLNQFDNNSGWNGTLCKSTNQNRMNMGSWRFMSLYYKSSYPPTSTKRHYRPRVWGVVLVRVWVDRVPKTRLAKKPQSDPLNLCSFYPWDIPDCWYVCGTHCRQRTFEPAPCLEGHQKEKASHA